MTDRPILFSGPMVRAILSGTKTQTRRVVKPQPADYQALRPEPRDGCRWVFIAHSDRPTYAFATGDALCPYGQPGSRLWVREAWRAFAALNKTPPRSIPKDAPIWYEAQDEVPFHPTAYGKLRPGMFMPRWASRITLEITGVRVERLQDISDADAKAEGAEPRQPVTAGGIYIPGQYRLGFRDLWVSINGPCSWDANPWVWVVEFKRLEA
jgi:hypothetical protein